MDILRIFYNNESQREAVKEFMIETLKEIAVERTFGGEDTYGIKDAKELVDETFSKLEKAYGKIEEKVVNDPR